MGMVTESSIASALSVIVEPTKAMKPNRSTVMMGALEQSKTSPKAAIAKQNKRHIRRTNKHRPKKRP